MDDRTASRLFVVLRSRGPAWDDARPLDAAEIDRRIAADPWSRNGLLTTKQTSPWRLRLGTIGDESGHR